MKYYRDINKMNELFRRKAAPNSGASSSILEAWEILEKVGMSKVPLKVGWNVELMVTFGDKMSLGYERRATSPRPWTLKKVNKRGKTLWEIELVSRCSRKASRECTDGSGGKFRNSVNVRFVCVWHK